MARDDVNIKVSANVAEAIRMWQAMAEGPEAMAKSLDSVGRRGKQAGSGMQKEFDRLVGTWVSVRGAISAAKTVLNSYIEAQKESLRLRTEATVPVDTLSRQFQVQAGLTNQQASAARQSILATAQQRGFAPQGAFAAGTQLVSSGFDAQEVTEGGALNEFLKLLNATNAAGADVDSRELAKAAVKFLKATEQDKSAASLRRNALGIQGLFKSTDIQTAELEAFAPRATDIHQFTGLKEELLPLLSQFLDVTNVEQGGTAFTTAITRLGTAGATPQIARALKSIGLKPEDVDFQGEDFFQVQKRLADAFDSVSPEQANIAARQILGQRGLKARPVLFSQEGVAETQKRLGLAASPESFQRDVAITEGSVSAQRRRAESSAAEAFFEKDFVDPDAARRNLMTELKRRGFGPFRQNVARSIFERVLSFTGDAGAAVEQAADLAGDIGLTDADRETIQRIKRQSRARDLPDDVTSSEGPAVRVEVELQDQNKVAIPHKSAVNQLSEE